MILDTIAVAVLSVWGILASFVIGVGVIESHEDNPRGCAIVTVFIVCLASFIWALKHLTQ